MIYLDTQPPATMAPDQQQQFIIHSQRSNLAHVITLVLYSLLLALFTLHQWLRPEGISLFQWCVQCGPLLIFWLGLRKRNRRTYLWLCFVLLLYFIKGVEGSMSPTPDAFDFSLLFFSTTLFISSMMTARWQFLREKALFEHHQATA